MRQAVGYTVVMANTTQYAFRLPPEHIELLEERAARLAQRLGVPFNRTDALKMLLDFAQKVERVRKARIASYAAQARSLPPGPDRERVQQAREDWDTMTYERLLGLAELQAVGSEAVERIRRSAKSAGLDRLSEEDVAAEVRGARQARARRR